MVGEFDWFSPEAMTDYFHQLYSRIQSFDKKYMKHYLYNVQELMFETAAKEFQLIDDSTTSVVVNWKKSLSLIEKLKREGPSYALVRELSQYSVNLRQYNLDQMIADGIVAEVIEGIYVAAYSTQYNTEVGLLTENQWLEETLII